MKGERRKAKGEALESRAGEKAKLLSPFALRLSPFKTVCRCNNIKYGSVARAIREGAWTLHQVATHTTATTGHCGGSCTPDVQQMLAEIAPKHAMCSEPTPLDAWWVRRK